MKLFFVAMSSSVFDVLLELPLVLPPLQLISVNESNSQSARLNRWFVVFSQVLDW